MMENEFGGCLTHDSGHGKNSNDEATTWIISFPRFGDAQIAVPMNVKKLSLLMRGRAVDGRALDALVDGIALVEKRHTDPKRGVASSVLGRHAPFLNPSPSNPLLRVKPTSGSLRRLLELYLGRPRASTPPTPAGRKSDASSLSRSSHPLTEDELRNQLERQCEIGQAGEFLVVEDELERLRQLGCPDPNSFVERVAIADVGRGYDIESTWPGEERCIEVKTSSRSGSDFFITANESKVLASLEERGWLYRVTLNADGQGTIVQRLNNPMKHIHKELMTPVVWRVSDAAFKNGVAGSDGL